MTATYRTLADLSLADYCAGAPDAAALAARLATLLNRGTTRRAWCWAALEGSRVVARQSWWAPPGATAPAGVDLITTDHARAAAALLTGARARLRVRSAVCQLHAPPGDDPSKPTGPNGLELRALGRAGFSFAVARISVEWTSSAVLPVTSGRLSYVPADEVDEADLVALFSAVADGSLDHGMRKDRETMGATCEAAWRLQRARAYRGGDGWFRVGRDGAGSLVGYVVPGIAGSTPMIAEIGVSADHRGRRYVDDLLAEGTTLLVREGADRIIADTDLANLPMRSAFERSGYSVYRRRDDYAWRCS